MIILSQCARGTTVHELWGESSSWLLQARGLAWPIPLKLRETSPYIGILNASGNIIDITLHQNTRCFVRTFKRNMDLAMIGLNWCFPIEWYISPSSTSYNHLYNTFVYNQSLNFIFSPRKGVSLPTFMNGGEFKHLGGIYIWFCKT